MKSGVIRLIWQSFAGITRNTDARVVAWTESPIIDHRLARRCERYCPHRDKIQCQVSRIRQKIKKLINFTLAESKAARGIPPPASCNPRTVAVANATTISPRLNSLSIAIYTRRLVVFT
jgi:hypothetical protein